MSMLVKNVTVHVIAMAIIGKECATQQEEEAQGLIMANKYL